MIWYCNFHKLPNKSWDIFTNPSFKDCKKVNFSMSNFPAAIVNSKKQTIFPTILWTLKLKNVPYFQAYASYCKSFFFNGLYVKVSMFFIESGLLNCFCPLSMFLLDSEKSVNSIQLFLCNWEGFLMIMTLKSWTFMIIQLCKKIMIEILFHCKHFFYENQDFICFI